MVAFSKLPVMISYEDIIDKRYENGKIYLIKSKTDDNMIYVGCTIKTLSKRFIDHKSDIRKNKNTTKLSKYDKDIDDLYIELYENYPCKNRYFLEEREGEIIKLTNNINIRSSSTEESKKKYIKNYNDNYYQKIDKEKKNKIGMKYYYLNREKIAKRRKELRDLKKQNV